MITLKLKVRKMCMKNNNLYNSNHGREKLNVTEKVKLKIIVE